MTRAPLLLARTFRRAALPLAAYYTVTLVVPLANVAAFSDAFVGHALIVLLVPLAIVALISALRIVSQMPSLFRTRCEPPESPMPVIGTTKPLRGGTKPKKRGKPAQGDLRELRARRRAFVVFPTGAAVQSGSRVASCAMSGGSPSTSARTTSITASG